MWGALAHPLKGKGHGDPPGWKMPHFSDLCVGTWGIGEGGRRSNGQSEGKASKEAHQDGLQGQEVRAHGASHRGVSRFSMSIGRSLARSLCPLLY
jgi:hypothetical protein